MYTEENQFLGYKKRIHPAQLLKIKGNNRTHTAFSFYFIQYYCPLLVYMLSKVTFFNWQDLPSTSFNLDISFITEEF